MTSKANRILCAMLLAMAMLISGIAAVAEDDLVIGNIMITSASTSDLRNDQGIRDYVEGLGGKVVSLDSEIDIVKANKCVDDLIAMGVDGIILNGISWEGHNSAILAAKDAGIPILIGYNMSTMWDNVVAQVTSDDYGAGASAGEHCVGVTGGKGQVILLDNPGASCVEERTKGFEDVVVAAGMEVVATRACSGVEAASSAMEDLLQAWPNTVAVMCNCDIAATGAIAAIKAAGMEGKVLVYGVDGNPENIKFIADGIQAGTAFSDNYNIGRTEAKTLCDFIVDGIAPEDKHVSLPVTFVTAENAQEYLAQE